MKVILFLSFVFSVLMVRGQYIFLQSDQDFTITNTTTPIKTKAIWINSTEDTIYVEIALANGKNLYRQMNMPIAKPYYVIENNKVRYRPNLATQKADTLKLLDRTSTKPEAKTNNNTAWNAIIIEINALPYEWEKSEKIRKEIATKAPSCETFKELLLCLKFDASRITLINDHIESIPTECLKLLEQTVAPEMRSTILNIDK